MRLHRFIGNFDLSKKAVEITDPKITKQIKAVLRLSTGDKIILADGQGREAEATITLATSNSVTASVEKVAEKENAPGKVNLYFSIIKKGNFELGLQKAVEAGVSSITPIVTERTVKTGLNFERLEKIIREASEQSGRTVLPRLYPISNFEDALIAGKNNERRMIFHPAGSLYKPSKDLDSVSIFIGPEGGFTDKEIGRAEENGYAAYSLGPLIMRAETAAMITTYRTVNGI